MKNNINDTKLGEVRFSIDQFNAPKYGQIISARVTQKRENDMAVEGSIAKINLEMVNFQTLQAILGTGGTIADLSSVTVEFVADEDVMKQYPVKELVGKVIDLSNAEVALKWVSRQNGGSWGGFKMIIDKMAVVKPQAPKTQ